MPDIPTPDDPLIVSVLNTERIMSFDGEAPPPLDGRYAQESRTRIEASFAPRESLPSLAHTEEKDRKWEEE